MDSQPKTSIFRSEKILVRLILRRLLIFSGRKMLSMESWSSKFMTLKSIIMCLLILRSPYHDLLCTHQWSWLSIENRLYTWTLRKIQWQVLKLRVRPRGKGIEKEQFKKSYNTWSNGDRYITPWTNIKTKLIFRTQPRW